MAASAPQAPSWPDSWTSWSSRPIGPPGPARLLAMVGAGVAGPCVLLAVGSLELLACHHHPLHDAIQVARRIAEGDGIQPVPPAARRNGGTPARAGQDADRVVHDRRHDEHVVAEQIGVVRRHCRRGRGSLSGRTLPQAERLDHSVQAINRLATSVQQTAELSRKTNSTVEPLSQRAIGGNHAVNQVVQTMRKSATAARRIGDIIGVIDGIAFQTNILA